MFSRQTLFLPPQVPYRIPNDSFESHRIAGIIQKYFPDLLYDFNVEMNRIILAYKNPRRVLQLVPGATKAWQRVSAAYISEESFRFSKDRLTRINKLIEKETAILAELKDAASSSSRNRRSLVGPIKELKENFEKIYGMFGNFEGASLEGVMAPY